MNKTKGCLIANFATVPKRMLVEWGPVIPEGKVEITISKYEKTAGAAA
nr:hypothetical protein [Escherichia coli]